MAVGNGHYDYSETEKYEPTAGQGFGHRITYHGPIPKLDLLPQ